MSAKWWWLILILIVAGCVTVYFSNKNKTDLLQYQLHKQDSVILYYKHKGDSLYQASQEKDSMIVKRDSLIALSKAETRVIYIYRDKTNKKIANDTLKSSDYIYLSRYLDSLVRANK